MINNLLDSTMMFIKEHSYVEMNIWIIIITTILFLFLHYNRSNKLLAQISILLGFIPVLIHETGHALAATVSRGQVDNIYMVLTPGGQRKSGSQGYAVTGHSNRLGHALISFMGYVFPPIFLVVATYLLINDLSFLFFIVLLLVFLYYAIHTSQKWLPITVIFILIFTMMNTTFDISEIPKSVSVIAYNVIMGLLLGEIIQSIYIITQSEVSNVDGYDGKNMQKHIWIPSVFWAFIWVVISMLSIAYSVYMIINHWGVI